MTECLQPVAHCLDTTDGTSVITLQGKVVSEFPVLNTVYIPEENTTESFVYILGCEEWSENSKDVPAKADITTDQKRDLEPTPVPSPPGPPAIISLFVETRFTGRER